MRNFKFVALALSVVLVLTGCAQLPRSGEIQSGPDLKSGLTTDYLYYSPSGPSDGDDPTAIVNGFLNAATGPQNDYSVARQYLSSNFQSKWNPSQEVLVQESRPELTITNSTSAKLVVKPIASVDNVGLWTSLTKNATRTLDYTLVKENNHWRISSAPNLTILVKPVFDVLFRSYALYFFDSQNKYLVPDLRWFPSRVSTGTRLVNALIAGPNQWLVGAVNNSFPAGTKLAIDAVTIDNGTAIVDLNTAATKADRVARSRMLSQLSATLNQLPAVYSVKIHIDHSPQEIALTNAQVPYAANVSLMVMSNAGIRNLASAELNENASKAANSLKATDFGFSPDLGYLALLSASGVSLARLNTLNSEVKSIDPRPGLLAPVIDIHSQVWTLGTASDSTLNSYDANGKLLFSSSGWISGGEHLAFGISREGSRLAILIKVKNTTIAYVAAIKRDQQGNPTGINNPRRVGIGLSGLKTISWANDNSLVGLAQGTGRFMNPTTIIVGGGHNELTPMLGARKVMSQNDSTTTYLLDDLGLLFEYRTLNWMVVDSSVIAAHYTGN